MSKSHLGVGLLVAVVKTLQTHWDDSKTSIHKVFLVKPLARRCSPRVQARRWLLRLRRRRRHLGNCCLCSPSFPPGLTVDFFPGAGTSASFWCDFWTWRRTHSFYKVDLSIRFRENLLPANLWLHTSLHSVDNYFIALQILNFTNRISTVVPSCFRS